LQVVTVININWRKPLIYSLLYLSGSRMPVYLNEIKKIDRLDLGAKREYQDKKLTRLLLYAYQNVPYYHQVLSDAKVVKGEKVELENFEKIPVLTKEIIRKEGNNLLSRDYKKRRPYENTSGGSTGAPVRFMQDKEYSEWNIANKIYYKTYVGQDIGERELRLWGSERDLLEGQEKLTIRIRNWLYNRKELNTFKMSENDMAWFVSCWNHFKPHWVEAYVHSIYELAKYVKKNNIVLHKPSGILVTAGTLKPEVKAFLYEVFSSTIFNKYGSREVGDIACDNDGSENLKISLWNQKIEFIEEISQVYGSTSYYKIIVTNLNNFSMPLIRYDIGDIGVKGDHFDDLKKVVGREVNLFKTVDGSLVDGEFFSHLFYFKDWVKNFQVIQKTYQLIEIYIVNGRRLRY